MSRLIEPNAVSPSKRLESIKRLAEMNINVMARLQPLFPIFLKEIENELIESLSENGCKHIITEFLKLPIEKNISNFKKLSELINWDIFEYFQNANAKKIGREWVLPAELIYSLSKPITRKIHELNMTHGFGDYGLNHLSDSSCCCGLDLFKGFENWFKGNFTYAIKSANQKKLKFDIIAKQYIPDGSIRELINSDSRNENSRIIEYLRDKWNSPGTINAPDSFLGVKCLNFKDKNGNFVYEKETERWT